MPYENLRNGLTLREQLNHLRFVPSLAAKFTTAPRPQAAWVPQNTFSLGDGKEELLWPVRDYIMSSMEVENLKDYYRDSIYPSVYNSSEVGARVF
jgi:hypothetical protein